MYQSLKILLLLSITIWFTNCDTTEPDVTKEEITIDSCTLEPNYVSTEGWQEVYIDLPNQTLMSFPKNYTTSLGYTFDTWGFNAKSDDLKAMFTIESNTLGGPPSILKEPLPDTIIRTLTEKNLVYSFGDSSRVMGLIYHSCYTNEWINHFRKDGRFFLKKDSIYEQKLNFNARLTEWDEVVTILSTVRVE